VDNFIRTNTNLPAENATFLSDLDEQIKRALQGVRRFGQDLRPPMLDDLGLLATLRWLVSEMKEQNGMETDLKVLGSERRLPPEAEFTLFRIVQEALRNIQKHAETSQAAVEVEFGEGKTRISVSDKGKGFKLSGSLVDLARAGKLGLAGMEERAHLIDGSLGIESEPGKGTTVVVEVPM
jgi:two-component system sensor histidine kinase DegS